MKAYTSLALIAVALFLGTVGARGAEKRCESDLPLLVVQGPGEAKTGAVIDVTATAGKKIHITAISAYTKLGAHYEVPKIPPAIDSDYKVRIPISIDPPLANALQLQPGANTVFIEAHDDKGHCNRRSVELTGSKAAIFAVLVGINNFDKFDSPLNYARYDAAALRDFLVNVRHVPSNHVYLLTDDPKPREAAVPPHKPAVMDDFLEVLAQLAENPDVQPDSTLIIFLSTHGFHTSDTRDYNDTQFFLFQNSNWHRDYSMLSKTRFEEYVKRIHAETKILLLDACYSGYVTVEAGNKGAKVIAGTAITGGKAVSTPPENVDGVYELASSQDTEPSWEIDDWQHGAFTYLLLSAAKDAGAADGQTILMNDVYEYMKKFLPADVYKYKGVQQHVAQTLHGDANKFIWAYKK